MTSQPAWPPDGDGGGAWLTEARARLLLVAAIALHAAMFLSLFFGYLDPLFDNSDNHPKGVDFFSIYRSGTFLLRGESIYSWDPADSVPYAYPYRYLPFFAFTAGVALNVLPPWVGYWLWVALIEVMLAGCAWLSYRLADSRSWGLIGAAGWYAYTPVYLEMYMGQWSFLMAALMLVAATWLIGGHMPASGLSWTASLLVKTNSALLGPIFVRLRQWKLLAVAGLAVVLLNAPYFIFAGGLSDFISLNFGRFYGDDTANRALNSVSGDLGGAAFLRAAWFAMDDTAQDLPRAFERCFVSSIILGAAAATFLPRRASVPALMAIWMSTFFLVYPTWEHHYVMLLPALALLIVRSPEHRTLALVVLALTAVPTPYALFELYLSDRPPEQLLLSAENFWPHWAAIVHHTVKTIPLFALWAILCGQQTAGWWRERATRPMAAAAASEPP